MRDARQLSAMRCSPPRTPRAYQAFFGDPPAGGKAVKERTSSAKDKSDERTDVPSPVSLADTALSMGRKIRIKKQRMFLEYTDYLVNFMKKA